MTFTAFAIWFVGAVILMTVFSIKAEDAYDLGAGAFAAMLWPAFAVLIAFFSPVIIAVLIVGWWKQWPWGSKGKGS